MSDSYTNTNNNYAEESNFKSFNGFYPNVYKDDFITGHAFVFMTRPQLFLTSVKPTTSDYKEKMAYLNMTRDSNFTQYLKSETGNNIDSNLINILSYNQTLFTNSHFIPIITNECKMFTPMDTNLDSTEAFQTKQGFRQVLPTHKTSSEAASQFQLTVVEDSNLTFTKMLNIWVNYITNIVDGTFDANPDMVSSGKLDYVTSLFYFVLEPDGRTLKYWAKYTGCWPTQIPYASLSYQKGETNSVDIPLMFNYMVKEDMSPEILKDFNKISSPILRSTASSEFGDNNLDYIPIIGNDLLSYSNILSTLSNQDKRDPIIVYKNGVSTGTNQDSTKAHYELLFDNDAYIYNGNSELKDGEYYLNDKATNTIKTTQDDFWFEESI